MKTKDVTNGIDFADAYFKSCALCDELLSILVISWDEREIELTFKNTIHFNYKLGGTVATVNECLETSNFLDEALKIAYDDLPQQHPYIEFQIVDVDDIAFIRVVAERLEIVKTNK